jgi:exportin-2 (importin alpha re-exporter)
MRIIVTARGSLASTFERTLGRLVGILGVISKNPSNPHFDQYIFESLSGLMRSGPSYHWLLLVNTNYPRFIVAASPATLPTFERALFQPFKFILEQDIDRMT